MFVDFAAEFINFFLNPDREVFIDDIEVYSEQKL